MTWLMETFGVAKPAHRGAIAYPYQPALPEEGELPGVHTAASSAVNFYCVSSCLSRG